MLASCLKAFQLSDRENLRQLRIHLKPTEFLHSVHASTSRAYV
jgi:hypothetical protein